MPDFKFTLTAKPPKPKVKKLGPRVVVHAGGRGGSGNIRRTKESATQPLSNSLVQVKSNSTTATAATAATAATVATSGSRATSSSGRTGSSAKSLSSSQNEHPDYGCSIVSPAGREVGLPRNKTTTSGRGGLGNAHDHVLEKGIFERVLAYEDAVTRSHQEVKTTRRTGRGGAGNIKGSKKNKHGPPSKRSFLTESLRSRSIGTKSSETNSHELSRLDTQTSVRTTDTNGVPLSTSSHSDQIPEALQEEGVTYNDEEGVEESEGKIVTKVTHISNGPQRNFSRPTKAEVLEAKNSSTPRRSPFRPSPESWATATTEALAHLKAAGVISQVPEVSQYAQTLSPSNKGITSPSPNTSRATENDIEIPAKSHFRRVAPGVSLYSPNTSEQTGLIPPSRQSQAQQSSKRVGSPSSDRSTELPYRRTREKRQSYLGKNVAIHSPNLSPDYSAINEESGEQKPAQTRAPSRSYWSEGSPCNSTSGHTDPLGDPPRYAAQSPPIPGSIADSSPHAFHPSATQTHEKQGSITSDETTLNLACYAFPLVPSPRPVHMLPTLRHSPQDRRREELVVSVEKDVQQSRWDSERRRDDYPSNPPPYGTTQSSGREPIDSGALYRSQRHRAERGFPSPLRDDPSADRKSSSPAPVSSSPVGTPYRSQDSRASPAPQGRHGEHRGFLPGQMSTESRPISPGIDPTRLQNHRDDFSADRRLIAITEDIPQGRQPLRAGHSSGLDRGAPAEHAGHFHLRRVRSKHRDLSLRELQIPATPLPPTPSSHHPNEKDSLYHSHPEPRHFSAFEDRYSPNYSSRSALRSSTTTVATQYDGIYSAASTVWSPSQLSASDDRQDELHDRIVNSVSARANRAKDDRAFRSDALDEYQHEESVTSDQGLKVRGRGSVEAPQSTNPGRTASNSPSDLTNTTTAVLKKEVNPTQAPRTVVVPRIRPARSFRMPNTEEEAPLHIDELNVPPPKPLSKMEKALLRRVEFGSNIDYSKLWVT